MLCDFLFSVLSKYVFICVCKTTIQLLIFLFHSLPAEKKSFSLIFYNFLLSFKKLYYGSKLFFIKYKQVKINNSCRTIAPMVLFMDPAGRRWK